MLLELIVVASLISQDPAENAQNETEQPQRPQIRLQIQSPAAGRIIQARPVAPGADATEIIQRPAEVDLSGRWLLTLPAGWQQRATIEKLEDGRYRLPGHGNLNGIYELEGRTLTLVEHEDDPAPRFVWEIMNDNTLRLRIDENRAGATYLGATMGRQIDWESFENNSRTTSTLVRPRAIARPLQLLVRPAVQEVTLTGTAFNDESQPPYIETEDDIVFVRGIEAWPEDMVERTVTITGTLSNERITAEGTTLPARFVQLKTYAVEGAEPVTIE